MANKNRNLWPDFEPDPIITPKSILLEQGNFLSEKTQNILEAEVSTTAQPNGDIKLHFYIVAPNMDNYKYLLLNVTHKITTYPLILSIHSPALNYKCKNQEELLTVLEGVFKNESTVKIIQSLLAQSK